MLTRKKAFKTLFADDDGKAHGYISTKMR